MNRRINTRVVHPTAVIPDMLIEKNASEIYFITVTPEVWLTAGEICIYDGFDAGGKLVWGSRPAQTRDYNFIPPIHCEQGIFVHTTVPIAAQSIHSYTIHWRPKKWDRPKPMKEDVIEAPLEEVPA